MGCETELKYVPCTVFSADILFDDELVAPCRGKLNKLKMHTDYLDTSDGDAGKRGITLRRRFENGVSVIYAKCNRSASGALSVRGEWSVKSDDVQSAADLLRGAGAPTEELCGMPLKVTASVRFERKECLVTPYPGFSFMLSFDEGFFGSNTPFSEIELELREGTAEELVFFGEKLAKKYGMKAETRSKYARALQV